MEIVNSSTKHGRSGIVRLPNALEVLVPLQVSQPPLQIHTTEVHSTSRLPPQKKGNKSGRFALQVS